MRLLFACVILVGVGCASEKATFECTTDAQCTLAAKPGLCVDKNGGSLGVCALTDPNCPSGFRYHETAGKNANTCYVFPDGSVPPDLMVVVDPDLSRPVDMSPDLTPPPDMALVEADMTGLSRPTWTAETSNTSATLNDVWGSAANDVYVVGENSTLLHSTGNGTWTPQSIPVSTNLKAVWGSSATNVYVAGHSINPSTGTTVGVVLKSTGNGSWTPVTTGAPSCPWNKIVGSSATDVYFLAPGCNPALYHSDGGSDNFAFASANLPGGGNYLGLWTNASNFLYVVADDIRKSSGFGTNFSGAETLSPAPTGTVSLRSIHGATANAMYVVGNGGRIYFSTGNGTWTIQMSGVTADLVDVFAVSTTDVYAVAYYLAGSTPTGAILHSTGDTSWQIDKANTAGLLAIWGSGSNDVYAVGANGTILHAK